MFDYCNLKFEIKMASTVEDRYVFETEWFDQQASLVRKYLLTYYPKDSTIDMVSINTLTLRFITLLRALLDPATQRVPQEEAFHSISFQPLCAVRFEKQENVLEENGLP